MNSAFFAPEGARDCSHGWSGVRPGADAAQPVEGVRFLPSCPGGAKEPPKSRGNSIEHICE